MKAVARAHGRLGVQVPVRRRPEPHRERDHARV
jgi:hypothetical protein